MYTAPEAFARLAARVLTPNIEEDKKTDVYSFAIICYETMMRKKSWSETDPSQVEHLVRSGQRPPYNPEAMSKDPHYSMISGIMMASWNQEYMRRPSFQQIHDKLQAYK